MNTVVQKIPAKELEWEEIGGRYTWYQARALEKDDWRLPTKEELLSLRKVKLIPSGNWYWSLCPGADNNNSAWYVNLHHGYENYGNKYNRYNVCFVRELPATDQTNLTGRNKMENTTRFKKLDSNFGLLPDTTTSYFAIWDPKTDLIWDARTPDTSNWLSVVEKLRDRDVEWRLPTLKELGVYLNDPAHADLPPGTYLTGSLSTSLNGYGDQLNCIDNPSLEIVMLSKRDTGKVLLVLRTLGTELGLKISSNPCQVITTGLPINSQVEELLATRETTHGSYSDTALYSQTIKSMCRGSAQWNLLSNQQRESLDMIATKIARILSGNADESDHWKDIAGYAKLVEKSLEKKV